MVRKLALFLFAVTAAWGQSKAPQLQAVFFALEMQEEEHGGYIIAPFLVSGGATYKAPPLPSEDPKEQKRAEAFQARVFRSGTVYKLFSGGKAAGEVKVLKDISDELGTYASVDVTAKGKKPKLQGIATNAAWLKESSREERPLTAEEAAKMRALAAKYLKARAVPARFVEKMEITGSTAGDLDGDGRVELVATFRGDESRKDVQVNRSLLLLSQDGTDVVFASYLSTGETDVQTEVFFDHLDIDGDGVDELIISKRYYEDAGYDIYSRKLGKWKKVYSGPTSGP